MTTLEIKKGRMSNGEDLLAWIITPIMIAAGFYGVLQMLQKNSDVPPVEGRHVIEKTPLDIREFGLKAPIICTPTAVLQDCA